MLWGCGSLAHGADHGVVLLYHHIDDSTPPETSTEPHQFRAHLDYLDDEGFTVLRLSAMLGALARGEPVPDNAVAITFDDAYPSVYATATPELVARGMPFTVFIATDDIDRGNATYMTWAQLRSLDRTFADFGAHSLSHGHLLERRGGESEAQWRERAGEEIRASASRIETALDTEVASFAYPYGEYDEALVELVAAAGLYGLAQQSGAFGAGVSPQQVPRFPMGGGYDGLTRLVTAVRSRPLPVTVAASPGRRRARRGTDNAGNRNRPGTVQSGGVGLLRRRGSALDFRDRRDLEHRLAAVEAGPQQDQLHRAVHASRWRVFLVFAPVDPDRRRRTLADQIAALRGRPRAERPTDR